MSNHHNPLRCREMNPRCRGGADDNPKSGVVVPRVTKELV